MSLVAFVWRVLGFSFDGIEGDFGPEALEDQYQRAPACCPLTTTTPGLCNFQDHVGAVIQPYRASR